MTAATTGTRRTPLALTAAFAALEGFDLACYGVTVPVLLTDRGLGADRAAAGAAGSLVAVGMLVGAAVAGVLVRRTGSRRLLLGGTALFPAGMLVCALAPTFVLFGAARLVVGLGLGVVLPAVTTYVAEVAEAGRRSRDVGLMMAGYAAGALAAPLLGAALLPGASWRWVYLAGALPALVLLPLAARGLPRTVAPATPAPDARAGDLGGLRALLSPERRVATGLFWVVSFCGLLLVFGISTWLPTIMRTAGYPLGSSLLQTAAMWVGAGVGMVAGGRLADRVGVKPVVSGAFAAGAACLLLVATRPPLVLLFLLLFASGFGLVGSQVLANAFVVVHHPEDLRGPAIGWALSVGRLGAIVGPLMGAAILASDLAVAWNFVLFAVPAVVGAVLAALVPATRGRRAGRYRSTRPAS